MNMRLRRLYNDYQELTDFLQGHPAISLLKREGDPPEKYQFEYRLKSVEQKAGQVLPKDRHVAEVVLTLDYPTQEPVCRMLTPVFHPNIDPHLVCITDRWAASESLVDVVVRIGRMLSYQIYNIKSPRNGEAAKWTAENLRRFPLDSVDLALEGRAEVPQSHHASMKGIQATPELQPESFREDRRKPSLAGGPGAAQEDSAEAKVSHGLDVEETCFNCRQRRPKSQFWECPNGHRVCPDCQMTCRVCGSPLCLLCGFTICSVCQKAVCSRCQDFCHFHRQPYCSDHTSVCSVCGVNGCSLCLTLCPECKQPYCRNHFNKSQSLCQGCQRKREAPAPQTNSCPRCGKPLPFQRAKFCPSCGFKLQAV